MATDAMKPQTDWRPMRGRFFLFAAAALLAASLPAQAVTPLGNAVLLPGGQFVDDEVCVDLSTVFDDPTKVIVIASQCTLTATVSVGYDENGDLVVTIILIGYTVAVCVGSIVGPDGEYDVQTSDFYLTFDLIDRDPVCMN